MATSIRWTGVNPVTPDTQRVIDTDSAQLAPSIENYEKLVGDATDAKTMQLQFLQEKFNNNGTPQVSPTSNSRSSLRISTPKGQIST